jgi:lipopolysaccharide transport system ATP-binding protein
MSPAIRIDNLSKCYRINHAVDPRAEYKTLRESLAGAIKAPFRRLSAADSAKRNEDFWALKNVSFEVQPGEVVGIIGRNGAGKSTLLKILSRITKPSRGHVALHGRVGSLLEVGTGFHPELTGRENVRLNGSILGMSRREIARQFDAIVDFSGVEKFLDTPVKRYSSGMYVRLAFAVAAHLNPEILIVDEVLSVGDAEFQKKCLGKMEEVAHNGRTVIFVSHTMTAIARLCTRAILLAGGQVSFDGPAAQTVSRYLEASKGQSTSENGHLTRAGAVNPHEAHITEAWLERDNRRVNSFLSDDDGASVVLVVKAPQAGRLAVELVLRDQDSTPVAFAASGLLTGKDFTLDAGTHTFRCALPKLALAQGRYSLDLLIAESGVRLIDSIEAALTFTIEPTMMGERNWSFHQNIGRGCIPWGVRFQSDTPIRQAG